VRSEDALRAVELGAPAKPGEPAGRQVVLPGRTRIGAGSGGVDGGRGAAAGQLVAGLARMDRPPLGTARRRAEAAGVTQVPAIDGCAGSVCRRVSSGVGAVELLD